MTQFIGLGSSQTLGKINNEPLRAGEVDILLLDAVRDLGVVLDSNLTMKKHVDGIVRSSFYQLRQLWFVRRSLTFHAAPTLEHVLICSGVDYCNCILLGVSDGVIRKLQTVLFAAARLMTGERRNEPIMPTLLASSQAADHTHVCNDGFQLYSWYVPGIFL